MTERPYQVQCREANRKAFAEFKRVLDVLATGLGKTCIFNWEAQWRKEHGQRTLILAHRDELCEQAIDKLFAATGLRAEKEKAESHASLDAPIVVGSVQTLMRDKRRERWPRDHFGLVVVDEAHHVLAESYQGILSHFEPAQSLGVTATPDRGDQRNLGHYFDSIAFQMGLLDGIRGGWLSRVTVEQFPIRIDLSAVETAPAPDFGGRDYASRSLGAAIEPYLDEIARAIPIHAPFRRILAFLPLRDTSRKFVAACERAGVSARHIDGESPDRDELKAAFAGWEFDVLSNAMLLIEGYDDPGIDAILPLRPTKIASLFWQQIGRGTRLAPGKTNCVILDPMWLHKDHREAIMRPSCLVARDEIESEQIDRMVEESQPGNPEAQLDLEQMATSASKQREEALRRRIEEFRNHQRQSIGLEEFGLLCNSLDTAEYKPVMPWESQPPTPDQVKWLKRIKVCPHSGKVFLRFAPARCRPLDLENIKTRGQATKVLGLAFAKENRGVAMASAAQRNLMRQMGADNADDATAEDARKFFASLRKPKATEAMLI